MLSKLQFWKMVYLALGSEFDSNGITNNSKLWKLYCSRNHTFNFLYHISDFCDFDDKTRKYKFREDFYKELEKEIGSNR